MIGVCLVLLVCGVWCMRVQLTSHPLCLLFEGGSSSSLVFVTAGEGQTNNVHCTISQNGQIIHDSISNDQEFKHTYQSGSVEICFQPEIASDLALSFDFFNTQDPLKKIIERSDLKEVEGVLGEVHNQLMAVYRNQQFHIQRDEAHKKALQESEENIKIAGMTKIIILLASAFVQIWIMKGFFSSGPAYQPVQLM